ncbi:autotransporter-associated beta strand repeat-containing protein [Roseicyclus sp.]|uniref:autotransporter-associated beta strand repeat-containing protein n=1 Tax=Roseicyclus sp. TaxID=1914329 RepID=UPI001BCDE17E|nr:autotransporter-associated beta strand repeat-containing protein [Roseicyclus sp.]
MARAMSSIAMLRFDRSDDVIVNNVISGTGNLVKRGAGILFLFGANTYTGTTNVDAGTLRIGSGNALDGWRVAQLSPMVRP